METSFNNKKALEKLIEKFLNLLNDKGMLARYLVSSLVILLKPENKSQNKKLKDQNSIRMNDFLINTSMPDTLYSKMLNFRVSNNSFKLDGDLSRKMTNNNFNEDHSNPQDRKIK